MELRDIEIFLTLAEELHFGRTAERLHVTPARITQAIKKQERKIGALLFERTNRTVRLTAVGEQLRGDLLPHYEGFAHSMQRAKLAASGQTAVLRVGLMPFNISEFRVFWDTFRERHPMWQLRLRRMHYTDPFEQLRTGEFDAAVLWLPVREPDFVVGPTLCTDPRVLAVADDHVLAGRTEVSIEEIADFPVAMAPLGARYWEEGYLPFSTPGGRPLTRGTPSLHADDLIDMVSTGEVVHPFPGHVRRHWGMSNIDFIPIVDMPPLSFALVWRGESEDEPIRALAEVVRELGPRTL
ncbi:LysR family transcriptional regulator [Nocardia huaxiensis]|uniref:LysR family transcriptional regulator n=1 Tax=Nocardia huaxiensis TaxID=2755382 RepID=A0A7D6ZD02_9NOCA|nr:LysR family transcriptional regulator [Nocardia huaxiensis]QLY32528.1 LysR family transcriptional regulator [Nocardia huaxiensis]UFS93759.1 LysR family transcriptional regulator [Nocardia huaxiensis]